MGLRRSGHHSAPDLSLRFSSRLKEPQRRVPLQESCTRLEALTLHVFHPEAVPLKSGGSFGCA
jgi:hypothetical protein